MKKSVMTIVCIVAFCWTCFSGFAIAEYVTATIDGNGTWTDEIMVPKGERLNISIGDYNATTDMTVTLQRKLPGDSDWGRDVETWDVTGSSADVENITAYPEPEYCWYRIGCDAAADYTSGSADVRLGRDNY